MKFLSQASNYVYKTGLLIAVFAIQGCSVYNQYQAGTPDDASIVYKNNHIYSKVSRHIEKGFLGNKITTNIELYINNKRVLESPLHDDFSGELKGMYESVPISLSCKEISFFEMFSCTVHINNEMAGKLEFDLVI